LGGDLIRFRYDTRLLSGTQYQVNALAGQRLRDGESDTDAAAGNYRHFPLQT
jgi:hypothetical protein